MLAPELSKLNALSLLLVLVLVLHYKLVARALSIACSAGRMVLQVEDLELAYSLSPFMRL